MSTEILAPTAVLSGGVLYGAPQGFSLDTVVQVQADNPASALLTPVQVTLGLSSDGVNYVLAESRTFNSAAPGTSHQTFKLSDYGKPISAVHWVQGGTATPLGGPPKTMAPPWVNYQLIFSGNTGAAVTVSAVADGAGATVSLSDGLTAEFGPSTAGDVLTSNGDGTYDFAAGGGGGGGGTIKTLFSCGACAVVGGDTAEHSLLQSPTSPNGSLIIPAGTLVAGATIQIFFHGNARSPSGDGPLLSLYLGSTQVGVSLPVTLGSSTYLLWPVYPINISVPIIGASGKAYCTGGVMASSSPSAISSSAWVLTHPTIGTPVNLNTTVDLALDFRAQWDFTSGTDDIHMNLFKAMLLNS